VNEMWFAHSLQDPDRSRWEPLRTHLRNVERRAGIYAAKFGAGELGAALGLLHDMGKYDPAFLSRLADHNIRHDHSTAGACIASEKYGGIGKLLAYAIAGHHAGLPNGIREERLESGRRSLEERLKVGTKQAHSALLRAADEGIEPPSVSTPTFLPSSKALKGFQLAFFGRLLFSCLVDADFLETERFYAQSGEIIVERGNFPNLTEIRRLFESYLSREIAPLADSTPVNRLRSDILAHARSQAARTPGIFTLTVPTGGGKTLTSLAFALDHAVSHDLDRVVYVIPFTSIIEQTADIFRSALGALAGAVLEHHSSFDETRISAREGRDKLRLAMENWDAPLIVTTAVQFFESIFADRPSRCRKLHNLAKSVIIIDEVQTIPLALLRPCVAALQELARSCGTSIVLCTATQPALKETADRNNSFQGGFRIGPERELAPNPADIFQKLKRVSIEHAGALSDEAIAHCLAGAEQVLCIVNTRIHAHDLYARLKAEAGARHLSTLMCAAHRRQVLAEIRGDLKAGRPCRVISTSLIEAGVDIDFPLVYRAEAGLDSIAQAAGRCNREGRRDWRRSRTVIFEVEDKTRLLKALRINCDVGRRLVRTRKEDSLAPDTIEAYFRELYWLKGPAELDRHGVLGLLNERANSLDLPFETVAKTFQMIEDIFVPVIVPFGEAARLVEDLRDAARLTISRWIGGYARELQPYTVGVPQKVRGSLVSSGAAEAVCPQQFEQQFVWLTNANLYRLDTGLDWTDPTFHEAGNLMV
jgi:CRISPR-associated endonuclease/helicase Cas3